MVYVGLCLWYNGYVPLTCEVAVWYLPREALRMAVNDEIGSVSRYYLLALLSIHRLVGFGFTEIPHFQKEKVYRGLLDGKVYEPGPVRRRASCLIDTDEMSDVEPVPLPIKDGESGSDGGGSSGVGDSDVDGSVSNSSADSLWKAVFPGSDDDSGDGGAPPPRVQPPLPPPTLPTPSLPPVPSQSVAPRSSYEFREDSFRWGPFSFYNVHRGGVPVNRWQVRCPFHIDAGSTTECSRGLPYGGDTGLTRAEAVSVLQTWCLAGMSITSADSFPRLTHFLMEPRTLSPAAPTAAAIHDMAPAADHVIVDHAGIARGRRHLKARANTTTTTT